MADNLKTPAGAAPPAPAGSKVQPKKETVRISLPPKPAAKETVRLQLPPKSAAPSAPVAVTPPKPAAPAASDEVVTRLKDNLRSFSGRRSFILENGDVWEMDEPGTYSGPVLKSPEVIVRPGVLGTYVLKVPDAALRVRVRRAGPR